MNVGQRLVKGTCGALITGLRLEERTTSCGIKNEGHVWVHR